LGPSLAEAGEESDAGVEQPDVDAVAGLEGQVGLTFGFGAVGAIVSVMVRITRGSSIEAKEHGRMITMFGGAFRPIIGAVFGAMFYVLISGGLL
jgi:hypothetical protein